jgi:hypothetical protein
MPVVPALWMTALHPLYQLLQDLPLVPSMIDGENWPTFVIEDDEASLYDYYLRQAFYL